MKNKVYSVRKKICLKTGKVLSRTVKETDIDPEEYMEKLVEYVYQITKEKK